MTSHNNELNIAFHSFSENGNCLADIILPSSGKKVENFKIMKGPNGGIMIHMPASMGTTWTYSEITWVEVRQKVTQAYKEYISNMSPTFVENSISVKLYDFDDTNNCMADIVIQSNGMEVSGLRVVKGLGEGIIVHMPTWMHTKWSYTEISWSMVRQIVSEQYKKVVKTVTSPSFHFYAHMYKIETFATVTIVDTGTVIENIYVSCDNITNGNIRVYMPRSMNNQWQIEEIGWDTVSTLVIAEYRRQVLNFSEKQSYNIVVNFMPLTEVTSCLVDVNLPNKRNTIKGFKLHRKNSDAIKIAPPSWMNRWNDVKYSWSVLCKLIIDAYEKSNKPDAIKSEQKLVMSALPLNNAETTEMPNEQFQNPELTDIEPTIDSRGAEQLSLSHDKNKEKDVPKKEKSELGVILNAENNPFIFYPRTVLRLVDSGEKKKPFELVNAITRGSLGGIGPFEINLLTWVEKLRYVTKAMLLKLIEHGYVSIGWRPGINANKLTNVLNRMQSYNLINLTRFVTVDNNGEPDDSGKSIVRIITIGKTGDTLLHELGKNTRSYNPFDILQDGNTVKRYLSANQWLIYWLTTYTKQLNNYETSCIIHQKGREYSGARFYSAITLNDITLIGEPIRRCEEFETTNIHNEVCSKIHRLINMFDNLDQLYKDKDEIYFLQRPIIVLICEDDEHIQEIRDVISNIMEKNPKQTIWFTTDLRVFNKNMDNQRFLYFNKDEIFVLNESEFFNLQ